MKFSIRIANVYDTILEETNIIKVAHLVEYLISDASREEKRDEIKLAISEGVIDVGEGLDLIVEYACD